MNTPLHLFEAYGIELEYMIVDRDHLNVLPIADELLHLVNGEYTGDFENGMVTWSNELVLHVIEVKCTRPERDLDQLEEAFRVNLRQINEKLKRWNAMLLPTAAHPLMNPATETKLWPHDNNEIYSIYNQVFDCRGHGWSNLQSTHLNLPFRGDDEFARLHAACRVLLPLLPAICASSPVLDGRPGPALDGRMTFYKTNQKEIPSITGKIVPEAVFTYDDYVQTIYSKIADDIAPYNADQVLDPVWVNSRGAMARFDRGSIEIRVMDIQECPRADLAIQSFVINALKELVNERWCSLAAQKAMDTDALASILEQAIATGLDTRVSDAAWLQLFGFSAAATIREVVASIYGRMITAESGEFLRWHGHFKVIIDEGSLSSRILRALNGDLSPETIRAVWRRLATCLEENKMFVP